MAWRLARSLEVLRGEVLELHPGTTVWTIGDADHAATWSDHNPNSAGVVCASDTLGDRGLDLRWYSRRVVASGHPALKYVIYNRQIWSRSRASEGWRTYTGTNPHTGHCHVSVGEGADGRSTGPYDDTSPWGLTLKTGVLVPSGDPPLRRGSTGTRVRQLQGALNEAINAGLVEDGDFGAATEAAVRGYQRRAGLDDDGIYGAATQAVLREELSMPTVRDIWMSDGIVPAPSKSPTADSNQFWAPASFLRSTNDHVRSTLAEVKAVRDAQAAILDAVQGLDTAAVLARIDKRAAEAAARDQKVTDELRVKLDAAVQQRAQLLALVQQVASGEADAAAVVDEIARRLAG